MGHEQVWNVPFLPEEFARFHYTCELQTYFANKSNEHIAFKGDLEDFEQIDNNIFIEFSCPNKRWLFYWPHLNGISLTKYRKASSIFP